MNVFLSTNKMYQSISPLSRKKATTFNRHGFYCFKTTNVNQNHLLTYLHSVHNILEEPS